jgi:glycerol-3-phosphate dehydrogenase (NAD(P)+)
MTKLMTFALIKERINSGALTSDTEVTVAAADSKIGGTQVWLKEGEKFTVEELLYAMIIQSANDAAFAREAARQLHSVRLRIYANDDLVGVEVGGAVKNVLAIATGVCDGLGLGLNSRAALMTRGLAEIARLGLALGAERQTFMGLAGMGDLILTCTGDLSRNRRVGLALAQNKSLPQILEELGHVAEGVYTAREVDQLSRKLAVDMPISAAVAAVLDGRLTAAQALDQLMSRDPREEIA